MLFPSQFKLGPVACVMYNRVIYDSFIPAEQSAGQCPGTAGRRDAVVDDGGAGEHRQERQRHNSGSVQLLGYAGEKARAQMSLAYRNLWPGLPRLSYRIK